MGRARVVAPPPQDYTPEPLVAPVVPAVEETVEPEPTPAPEKVEEQAEVTKWEESNLFDLIEEDQPTVEELSPEEIERERIAQEKYEQLQKQKLAAEEEAKAAAEAIAKAKEILENPPVKVETIVEKVVEQVYVADPALVEELEQLKKEKEKLQREKDAAEKAREETILAARRKATQSGGNQMNMVKQRQPSLWSRFKQFLRERRVKVATVGIKNYETAILERARIAVPKMLDDIEKMHEQLTILEELIAKYAESKK